MAESSQVCSFLHTQAAGACLSNGLSQRIHFYLQKVYRIPKLATGILKTFFCLWSLDYSNEWSMTPLCDEAISYIGECRYIYSPILILSIIVCVLLMQWCQQSVQPQILQPVRRNSCNSFYSVAYCPIRPICLVHYRKKTYYTFALSSFLGPSDDPGDLAQAQRTEKDLAALLSRLTFM